MQIIPVIDLKSGLVVHAKHGQRAQYQPIQSCLCPGSQAHDVVAGLLALYPFQTFYIADIDAIQGSGSHARLIDVLCQTHPHIIWWVDNGNHPQSSMPNRRMVIGSESIHQIQDYNDLYKKLDGDFVLSLDYLNETPLGTIDLHGNAEYWPKEVICMTLHAVGSNQGADWQHISALKKLHAKTSLYAAGGVCDANDLLQLRAQGIAGALIATALHHGKISTQDIIRLDQ